MSEIKNIALYDWFFHYNAYTGYWNAVKREHAHNYMNGVLKDEDILKSKRIDDLIGFTARSKNKEVKLEE